MHTQPRQQHDLIGHDEAEQQIVQALKGGRMPHAWLINGAEGIGKATLAFRFARFLLSGRPIKYNLSVPAENSAAHLIAAGSHPDLMLIEREFDEKKGKMLKNIAVDDVRRIAPFLGMTASQGAWRVAIVDGADCLSTQAQNAILKTLEEPPEKSVLILTAENASTLLPTIRSRCRVLKLDKLSDKHLRVLGDRNGLTVDDPKALEFLTVIADGSAARLFRYAECDAYKMFQNWLKFLAAPQDRLQRLRLAESWAARDNEDMVETAQGLMRHWLQRLIKAKAAGTTLTPLTNDEKGLISSLYPRVPLDALLGLWENLEQQVAAAYASNLDRKVVLLNMLNDTAEVLAA